MNSLRISEKNRIKSRTRDVESFIKFNSNAIVRMRSATTNIDFNRKKIASLKIQNDEFSNEIKALTDRISQLNRGELDKELKIKLKADTKIAQKKTTEKRQKKLNELTDKTERSVISQSYWDRTLKAGREQRYAERSSIRGYDYVIRVQKTLPQHIRANLANMPNNKGYIWRGIHYYGHQEPEKKSNHIMFENKKGEIHIHEWSPGKLTHTLTVKRDKKGKGEVEFVEVFKRNEAGKRILVSKIKPPPGSARANVSAAPRMHNHKRRSPERKLTPSEARRRSRGNGRNKPNPKPKPKPTIRGRDRENSTTSRGGRGRGRGCSGGRGGREGRGRGSEGRRGGRGGREGRGRGREGRGRGSGGRRGGRGGRGGCGGDPKQRHTDETIPDRGIHRTIPGWMVKKEKLSINK